MKNVATLIIFMVLLKNDVCNDKKIIHSQIMHIIDII